MFIFRLAGHLSKTVAEIEDTMSNREFMEWVAFSRIEPIGGARLDFAAGQIQATTAACLSSSKHKLSDFVIDWTREKAQAQTPAMMAAVLMQVVSKKPKG